MSDEPKKTGLVCPLCQRPVGIVVNRGTITRTVVMKCTECRHIWTSDAPDADDERPN